MESLDIDLDIFEKKLNKTKDLLGKFKSILSNNGDDPDNHQAFLYEMVMSHAELSAADALLAYTKKVEGSFAEISQASAAFFIDEVLLKAAHRLNAFRCEHSVAPAVIAEATQISLKDQLSASNLASLGQAYLALQGNLGPDLLSKEQGTVRESLARFNRAVVEPQADAIHRQNLTVPDSIINGLKKLGCFGLSVPQKYGGLLDEKPDCLNLLVATEELSKGSLGAAGSLVTRPEIIARAMLAGATEAQKEKWLPVIASGAALCAVSVTEPDAGSDVAAVSLKATKTDQGWLLNGAKTWCTLAGKANLIMLLAKTKPGPKVGHQGLSLFLIEKPSTDDRSFEITQPGGGTLKGRAIPTLGYRGMHSFEMFYDQYLVPEANLIGGEKGLNRGFYFTMEGFAGGRIQTASRACGLMRAAYEAALRQAEVRKVFGQTLKDVQLIACRLAKMAIHILACCQFSYAAGRLMNENSGQVEASLVKIFACKTAEWVTREAMQIYGGMGYAEECSVSRYWADARVLSIFEGTEEVLALKVVGRHLMSGQ